MKAVNASALQQLLEEDLTWRRREVSDLLGFAQTGRVNEKRTARRALIPMMYAHWEGYTKNAFLKYFEFVAFRRRRFRDLRSNFLFLSARGELQSISGLPVKEAIKRLESLLERDQIVNKDPMRKHVNTRSNLRWDVLCELFIIAGIEMPSLEYETEIDVQLCDARNAIAHGESAAPEIDAIRSLRATVFEMLDCIKNTLVSAASNEEFLAKPLSP